MRPTVRPYSRRSMPSSNGSKASANRCKEHHSRLSSARERHLPLWLMPIRVLADAGR
jgi:hypothetical protein